MAAIIYASDELIEDSSEIDVVNLIISLFAEAVAEEEDKVITAGNGTTQPTGLTAATIGSVASATGNLSFDDLINLEYLLPAKYSRSASYLVHRSNIREMRKLKDSQNRYLWTDPVAIGQPATFHGAPVRENNNLGESEIYFGDYFKGYWLGDRRKMTIKITQDSETALECKRSINWVNCWNILKSLGQSAAKYLSKWQMKVQSIGFETAICGI